MPGLARKQAEQARILILSPLPVHFADEKHYSVIEISTLWALRTERETVRRIFEKGARRGFSGALMRVVTNETNLRVPETVLLPVHRKLRRAG